MRKITLMFIAIFMSAFGYSQISITANEVVDIGDVVVQANDDNPDPSIVPGDAGANMMWDFSMLSESSADTSSFVHPDDTPYGSDFPDANMAMVATDTGYFYMIKSPAQMSWIGLVTDMDTLGEINVDVIPEDVVATFPIEYGNNTTDSYYIMFDVESTEPGMDSIRIKMSTIETEEYDAWGQVTLPMGTYNALRVHSTSTTVDSIWIKSPVGWMFTYTFDFESESYSWWSDDPGTGFIIASLSMDDEGNVESATYMKDEIIQNIYENSLSDISVELFPNPVKDILHVKIAESFNGKIRIIDLTGQLIEEKTINSRDINIDFTQHSEGIYFYEITGENGYLYRSGKVIKQQ